MTDLDKDEMNSSSLFKISLPLDDDNIIEGLDDEVDIEDLDDGNLVVETVETVNNIVEDKTEIINEPAIPNLSQHHESLERQNKYQEVNIDDLVKSAPPRPAYLKAVAL